ncbi:MAG: hypothetical protein ACJ766_15315 [Thermoleophilaceae bacterium]
MPYGQLISDAFRITWRNRFLWFFGIFAGTSGGSFNFQFPSSSDSGDGSFHIDPAVVIALAAVALLLFVVFIVLSTISQGGLIDSVAGIAYGERRDFRTTWRAGRTRFWRVLGYGVLVALLGLGLILGVLVAVGAPAIVVFALVDSVVVRVLVVIMAALILLATFLVILVPLGVTAQLGLRELVLRRTGMAASIRGGWRLFRHNIGRSLLVLLIQQGIAIGAAIALGLALVLIALPTVILAVAAPAAVAIAVGALTALGAVPLALAAFGAIGSFGHAFWTLSYLRLAASTQAG